MRRDYTWIENPDGSIVLLTEDPGTPYLGYVARPVDGTRWYAHPAEHGALRPSHATAGAAKAALIGWWRRQFEVYGQRP